ncbi:hypothetical protein YC2023_033189 [Brassica napus]
MDWGRSHRLVNQFGLDNMNWSHRRTRWLNFEIRRRRVCGDHPSGRNDIACGGNLCSQGIGWRRRSRRYATCWVYRLLGLAMNQLTLKRKKLHNVSWNSSCGREIRRTCADGIAHLEITTLLKVTGRRNLGGEKI